MKLSIIVPVYNMAADGKLSFCLDSLVSQTIPKECYEIIAVDDASTDDSLSVLQDYASRYPKLVRVIHYEDNRRQGGAKNEGLRAAGGEWIGFIDSDDWIAADFYEKLLARAEETGADMVGCDYSLVKEHTMQPGSIVQNNTADQTGVLDEDKHRKLILRSGSMVIKIYRREVIVANGLNFPEHIFYEDNCAGPLWSFYFHHFERVEEPLYFYYQHAVSTVHHISVDKCEDRMRALEIFYEECQKRNLLERYRAEIEYRFAELYFVNTLFSYMQGVPNRKLAFVKRLRRGLLDRFPDFERNVYYQRLVGEEEKKWIAMLMRSAVRFFWQYRAVLAYRRIKSFHHGGER